MQPSDPGSDDSRMNLKSNIQGQTAQRTQISSSILPQSSSASANATPSPPPDSADEGKVMERPSPDVAHSRAGDNSPNNSSSLNPSCLSNGTNDPRLVDSAAQLEARVSHNGGEAQRKMLVDDVVTNKDHLTNTIQSSEAVTVDDGSAPLIGNAHPLTENAVNSIDAKAHPGSILDSGTSLVDKSVGRGGGRNVLTTLREHSNTFQPDDHGRDVSGTTDASDSTMPEDINDEAAFGSGVDHPTNQAFVNNACMALGVAGVVNAMGTVQRDGPPKIHLPLLIVFLSIVFLSAAIAHRLAVLNRGNPRWVASEIVRPLLFGGPLTMGALYGRAYQVGRQHFEAKTLIAIAVVAVIELFLAAAFFVHRRRFGATSDTIHSAA